MYNIYIIHICDWSSYHFEQMETPAINGLKYDKNSKLLLKIPKF